MEGAQDVRNANNAASVRTALAMALLGLASLGMGCATTVVEDSAAPTHRWISKTVESRAQYQYDNQACAAAAGEDAVSDGEGLRRDAPAFVAYEQCMGERGYQLATY